MQRLRQTSISLAIILLAMSSSALVGLSHPGEPRLGLVLAVSGVALMVSRRDLGLSVASVVRIRRGRTAAFLVATSVLAGTVISTPALKLFAWRFHDIPLAGAFYSIVTRILPGSARSGDLLAFWTGRGLEVMRLTFEGLGLYEIWYLAIGLMIFVAFAGARLTTRGALRCAAVIGVYALMRSLVVTALAIELGRPEIVWLPLYSVLSWLPLAWLLRLEPPSPILRDGGSPGKRAFNLTRQRTGALAGVLCMTSVLCLGLVIAFMLGYEDPGHLKQGRIMIDEGHADWEWADEPFDTTAYGIRAEYNYYCLGEYLGQFYSVSLNSEPISVDLLAGADVLMIKTPTEPFAPGEIDAIEDFVAGGGGLLLIGDHTNLFGMSTYLNAIAERFGMRFRCDDTFDIATTGFSHYHKPRSGFHPAVREVQDFGFLTSCSIEGGMQTRPVMLGSGLGSEEADYAHPNFFGNIAYDLCDRFGMFMQAGATAFGEGRVMLFSDSTCFSNFCMFAPGRCELALGLIDYLNRSGKRYPFVIPSMIALTGFLGFAAVRDPAPASRPVPGGGLAMLLSVLLAGSVLGVFATAHVNAALHGRLPQQKVDNVVLFDTEHTTASFLTYPGVSRAPGAMGFEVLYLCAQRVGAHPCTGSLGQICAIQPSGVVIVNPSRSFSVEDLKAVDTFLGRGGTLLLLESICNGASTANELLQHYGIATDPIQEVETFTPEQGTGAASGASGSVTPRLVVRGGITLCNDESGRARAAFVPVGRGALLVATDSFRYSHHMLGSLLERSRPSGPVRDIYSEVYALLRNLIRNPGPG